MRSKQISEWRLAEETAVSQSTINAILTGRSREQKDSTLEPLAAYFECSLAQLRGYEPLDGFYQGIVGKNQYPVIEGREIHRWIAEDFPKDYFTEFVKSSHSRGRRCFVFIANDDAMAPLIPAGRKVFIDPDAKPDATGPDRGRVVLLESGGYYGLREEVVDLGKIIFKAMAAGYRTIELEDCVRIGYVVGLPEENWTDNP